MCGIAGMIAPAVDQFQLDRMTDAIAHRGPDGRGTWVSPCGHVGLGHRRLSILDLSPAGAQPMRTEEGDLTIVFNGEIYNHVELRRQLLDFPYRGHSDTEVILAAYRKWGRNCLERFNGMFAFALWDAKRQELFCARDRLGVKPFFFARWQGGWVFGSEVKTLLAGGLPAAPNRDVWGRYLTYGAFERPTESFFAGVAALAPGRYMVVKPNGDTETTRWWYLPERVADRPLSSDKEAPEALAALLDEAVGVRLRSDVPVALNLTGGLDSSSVASSFLGQIASEQEVHVFTAAFNDPRYDEDAYADRMVAGHACRRHVTRLLPEAVPGLAARAIRSQEGPFGGIGTLAYETVHEEMRRLGLKVALEGQGGDELFAGYAYFQPLALLDLLESGDWQGALAFARQIPNGRRICGLARRIRAGNATLYQDGTDFLAPECISDELRRTAIAPDYPHPFTGRLANALYRDLTETKLQRVLRMNDRLSMAHGVELRQPFLDWRLVEFAASLPSSSKLSGGWGKFVLRRAVEDRLPKEIVWAHKRPVVTPQREWMTGPLRGWLRDILGSRGFRECGFFDRVAVDRTLDRYESGGTDNAFPIWQWINAALWFDAFIERDASV